MARWQMLWRAVKVILGQVSLSVRKMCFTVGEMEGKGWLLDRPCGGPVAGLLGTINTLIRINMLNPGFETVPCRHQCGWFSLPMLVG